MKCESEEKWLGCYSGTFDLIAPESMAHPAKMSPALCFKIIVHLEEMGLLKKGMTILDPMGGTGLTCICANFKGYRAISVELEEKFVTFQQKNKEYAARKLCKELDWEIIQGDSRYLSKILAEKGLVSVMSPPYESALPDGLDRKGAEQMVKAMYEKHSRTFSPEDFEYQVELLLKRSNRDYGKADGQIGVLKDKLITIVSPPYADAISKQGGEIRESLKGYIGESCGEARRYTDNADNIGNLKDKPITVISPPYANRVDDHGKDQRGYEGQTDKLGYYGESKGQISHLKDKPITLVSPPYADAISTERCGIDWSKDKSGRRKDLEPAYNKESNLPTNALQYSADPQNIGNLSDKPITITSPPYGLGKGTGHGGSEGDEAPILKERNVHTEYNDDNEENIGNNTNETYLDAMRLVYTEIAKVSDVLVVVTKNPTRNGQLRRLDSDTLELLKQTGWTIHCTHKAMLFHEHEVPDLFGETHKKVKGRLSFFKRLSYQKGGVVAQWEDIIIAVKGNWGGVL